MCFPVYKMVDGKWKLHAVYIDFAKLMTEYGEGKKYAWPEFCWEPWPVDQPFDEANGFLT